MEVWARYQIRSSYLSCHLTLAQIFKIKKIRLEISFVFFLNFIDI